MMPECDQPQVNFDAILATNSDIVGKKWWGSQLKTRFDFVMACGLAHNPITYTLILGAMAGSVIIDKNKPITHVPFVHPLYGQGFKSKVTSMHPNATELIRKRLLQGESLFQIRESGSDNLVTPYGKKIRHYSLDELPQLFNVLMKRSNLTLVGPRVYGIDEYNYNILPISEKDEIVKTYLANLNSGLRFGVVGLASVFERHAPLVRRFKIENLYAEKASWIGDIRILAGVARISRLANGV